MKKTTMCAAAAAVLAVGVGSVSARAASDPVAAVQADIQKLTTDAGTLHGTVLADAQKISADVASLQGSDRKTVAATLKADVQKIQSDRAQLLPAVQSDWTQLKTDLQAARQAKAGKGELKPLLQQMNAALAQERDAVKTALQSAHQAAQALRQSLKGSKPGSNPGTTSP
jgi:hypothetical protein